jgi:hypothetical protein
MFSVLKPHRWELALLLLAANMGLLLHLACGELKSVSEWVWLDIVGDGGSALLALVWLGLVLKSRPAGRVTNYLAMGLSCIFFSWWIDSLDEFIRLPDSISWDHWLESGPMPVGMILSTLGIYHWHREQLAISAQMEKREKLFREHPLFDKLTPLGGADHLKRQLISSLEDSQGQAQTAKTRHRISTAGGFGAQARGALPVSDQGLQLRRSGGLPEIQRCGELSPFLQALDRQYTQPDPRDVQYPLKADFCLCQLSRTV